jgi:hypothetical protein
MKLLIDLLRVGEDAATDFEQLDEISPLGWKGTTEAMKKHKGITNPWALSWYMKKKGAKSHIKEEMSISPDKKFPVEVEKVFNMISKQTFADFYNGPYEKFICGDRGALSADEIREKLQSMLK